MPDTDTDTALERVLRSDERYAAVEEVVPDGGSTWSIAPEVARLLARIVVTLRRRSVLEFGAGRSSLVLARAMALGGGGRITSVDDAPQYCAEAWERVKETPGVDATLVVSRVGLMLDRSGLQYGYVDARREIAGRGPFDLVLIDGPFGGYGRDMSLHLSFEHLAPGALIVLDDAARRRELTALRRWRRIYPGLAVVHHDPAFGRGIAILRLGGDRTRRLSLRAILGSLHDRLLDLRRGPPRPPGGVPAG